MNSTPSNGSRLRIGHKPPLSSVGSNGIQLPRFSSSDFCNPSANRCPVVSLPLYRAQRRRATLAAQANARRRTVVALVLVVAGLLATATALHRNTQLPELQHVHYN